VQGLLDIHAVRCTPSAIGSGLDQPSSIQLQHWALTDKPEGMLVDASGQEQAADSGHSLVASASESAASGIQDADPARLQHTAFTSPRCIFCSLTCCAYCQTASARDCSDVQLHLASWPGSLVTSCPACSKAEPEGLEDCAQRLPSR